MKDMKLGSRVVVGNVGWVGGRQAGNDVIKIHCIHGCIFKWINLNYVYIFVTKELNKAEFI